jgi:hypothetical protein
MYAIDICMLPSQNFGKKIKRIVPVRKIEPTDISSLMPRPGWGEKAILFEMDL